jgi:hypothetical protein
VSASRGYVLAADPGLAVQDENGEEIPFTYESTEEIEGVKYTLTFVMPNGNAYR